MTKHDFHRMDIFPAITANASAPLFDRYVLVVRSRGTGDRVGFSLHSTFKKAFGEAATWHAETGGEIHVHAAGDGQRPTQPHLSTAIAANAHLNVGA